MVVLGNRNCQSQCKKTVRSFQPLAALPHLVACEFFIFRRIRLQFSKALALKKLYLGSEVRYNKKTKKHWQATM